jgi:hypothetical protein
VLVILLFLQVGGIKPGCFRIGNTGGMIDNVLSSKLYRPGRSEIEMITLGKACWLFLCCCLLVLLKLLLLELSSGSRLSTFSRIAFILFMIALFARFS